jgi:hypothetical protein
MKPRWSKASGLSSFFLQPARASPIIREKDRPDTREMPAMSHRFALAFLSLAAAPVLLLGWSGSTTSAVDVPKTEGGDVAPRTVTLQGKAVPLAKALGDLKKQTDIVVEDRRENKLNVNLNLALDKATFWQALDAIAKEADARVSLYERDARLALRDGPFREVPISYSGIFRVTVKRTAEFLDLETDAHFTTATLEIAWEPSFRPFYLETQPKSLVIQDDKSRPLEPLDSVGGRTEVGRISATVDVRLPAVPRSVKQLGLLKGSVALIGPKKWLTFTFDDLKNGEQTKDGVTVKLSKANLESDLWTLDMDLIYPSGGPKFESFESWLVYNEAALVKKDDPEVRLDNSGYETGDSSGTRASLSYHFEEDVKKKLRLGKPGDWKLVYRTPGPISAVPVLFEFKGVQLP